MRRWILGATCGAVAAGLAACSLLPGAGGDGVPPAERAQLRARAAAVLGTPPPEAVNPANPVTPEKITLGRMLYYEPRVSASQEISCNSCHLLDRYGVDGQPTSLGHEGQRGDRNAPTVYHAAFHVAQFWDGRARDVEEQAKGPVLNPVEMAMPTEQDVERVLRSIPGYAPLFQAAFPGQAQPVTFDNMALAIAAFERRLVTPSRFDAFLAGDDTALTGTELRGLREFLDVGCTTCHVGPVIGGSMFQKLGVVHPYETEDLGRYKVTGNEADRYVFKVPSLRNITETGPYFHDGSIATLDEAVRKMAWHQLGRELTDEQVRLIVTFLGSLTGPIDAAYIAQPELPPSGPQTPPPADS